MATAKAKCGWCGKVCWHEAGHINRSRKLGMRIYCDRKCAGLGRRSDTRTPEQKIADKAEYDRRYRELNRDKLKAVKREYFKRTYDPIKAAAERKARMPRHVEYCRRPEYVAWKRDYDRKYRAKIDYGPLWETHLILLDLQGEIDDRADRYEIYQENGRLQRGAQKRKRNAAKAHSAKSEIGAVGHTARNPSRVSQCGRRGRRGVSGAGNPASDQHAASHLGAVQPRRAAGRHQVL